MNDKFLFVAGAPKTGTSTLMGILNCSPDIFLFFELSNKGSKKNLIRQNVFCKYNMYMQPVFKKYRNYKYSMSFYSDIKSAFASNGFVFKYIGEKMPGFHYDFLKKIRRHKTVFTIRDIKTWLAKSAIIGLYNKKNVSQAATDYIRYYIFATILLRDSFFVRLEDFVKDNFNITNKLAEFVGMPKDHFFDWQIKIKRNREITTDNIKSQWMWVKSHSSSWAEPRLDIKRTKISKHDFWNDILPIFNRYYNLIDDSGRLTYSIEQSVLKNDIKSLKEIQHDYSSLLFADCYRKIEYAKLYAK